MVVCKYFQQGNCRYGQICRFRHTNIFGGNAQDNGKQFSEGAGLVLAVAEEVLAAERGGQWLLSCFGPLMEQACIPGMDDVSPEEVRWEIYQAQKNGTVDQTKLQFQELCQAMTAKREALKNPTHDTLIMLQKLQKTNREGSFGASPTSTTAGSSNNVFAAKSFGTGSNPFGGGGGFTGSGTSSSIFGRTPTANTSVFGGKPTFGCVSAPVFGAQTSGTSVFGSAAVNKPGGTIFGANSNINGSMQTFATAGSAVFGGTAPSQQTSVFAQPSTFGSTPQPSGPFSQPSQSGSVFGAATTNTTSPFGAETSTIFGAAKNPSNVFGSPIQPGNSIFGAPAGTTTTIGSTSIFAQPKNTAAFGGAPVFGSTGFAGTQQPATIFGGPGTFESPVPPNVFGTGLPQSTTFGSNSQVAANANTSFGALATSVVTPFGSAPATTNSAPFGGVPATTNSTPFGTPAGPFAATTATSPFARTSTFGASLPATGEGFSAQKIESPFGTSPFGTVPAPNSQPFGAPAFGNAPSTPFASTTSTATTSNPFAPRSQQQTNSPFANAQTTVSSSGNFGQSYGSITTPAIIDETAYTLEENMTDHDKSLYLSDQFVLGKIPVKPPTIELR